MFEIGVFLRRQVFEPFKEKRGHPVWIVGKNGERRFQKSHRSGLVFYGSNGESGHGPSLAVMGSTNRVIGFQSQASGGPLKKLIYGILRPVHKPVARLTRG